MKKTNIECPNCKYEGEGKYITKGSFAVEVVLWLLFLLPGIVYSVWRLSSRICTCPRCRFENVIIDENKTKTLSKPSRPIRKGLKLNLLFSKIVLGFSVFLWLFCISHITTRGIIVLTILFIGALSWFIITKIKITQYHELQDYIDKNYKQPK